MCIYIFLNLYIYRFFMLEIDSSNTYVIRIENVKSKKIITYRKCKKQKNKNNAN